MEHRVSHTLPAFLIESKVLCITDSGASLLPEAGIYGIHCPDMFATSYRGQTTAKAGDVAARAEERKLGKYQYSTPTKTTLLLPPSQSWKSKYRGLAN